MEDRDTTLLTEVTKVKESEVEDKKVESYGLTFKIPGLYNIRKQLDGFDDWKNSNESESSDTVKKDNNDKKSFKKKKDFNNKQRTYYPFLKKLSNILVDGKKLSLGKIKREIDKHVTEDHCKAEGINYDAKCGKLEIHLVRKDNSKYTYCCDVVDYLEEAV